MENNNTRQDLGDVLYCVENSVEYWTVKASGESAISLRGLSAISGIPRSTLSDILINLSANKAVNGLEHLYNKELYLSDKIKKRGKLIKPIKSDIAAEIIEYAIFDLGLKNARKVIKETNKIGFTTWVQGKTGYLSESLQQATKESRDKLDAIIQSLPRKWELHFDKHWQTEACRLTGYRWTCDIRMAAFISRSVYQLLPKDVYNRLMSVNAGRKHKHHQFFTEQADELILKQHIQRVYGLILASNSIHQFWRLMKNAFSDGIQCDLDLDI